MKLSIGIVGLPNVGKSTLFKLLTKQDILIANYPFTTIDPNVGIVPVPDERLDMLAQVAGIERRVPAVIEFCDIAGLVKNAHKGEGLGNQFLAHIRETDAITIILRAFANPEVMHTEPKINPLHDLEIVNDELRQKDLETIEKRLEKAEAEAKSGAKEAVQFRDELLEMKRLLQTGAPSFSRDSSEKFNFQFPPEAGRRANKKISELNLLTVKKQLYLVNGQEKDISDDVHRAIRDLHAEYCIADLANIETAPPELIEKAYHILGLITFYTMVGEKEVRAWPIRAGTSVLHAAGEIHTDFKEKFIKAEVISCGRLLEAQSWAAAKHKGWLRLEGKEYVVQDGDILVVRHG